jgi:hypothetical protein
MLYRVYRADLQIEDNAPYQNIVTEEELTEQGLQDLGTITLGEPIKDNESAHQLGLVPTRYEISSILSIIAISEYMDFQLHPGATNNKYGPDLSPYPEIPKGLKGIGQVEAQRFVVSGLFYPSNSFIGWMKLDPENT